MVLATILHTDTPALSFPYPSFRETNNYDQDTTQSQEDSKHRTLAMASAASLSASLARLNLSRSFTRATSAGDGSAALLRALPPPPPNPAATAPPIPGGDALRPSPPPKLRRRLCCAREHGVGTHAVCIPMFVQPHERGRFFSEVG